MIPQMPFTGLNKQSNFLAPQQIKQFNINPQIMFSKVEKGIYYLKFNNMCYSNQVFSNGTLSVDNTILKQKLNSWLRPEDRKYIKLVNYNTNTSIFAFNIKDWVDDAFKDTSGTSINYLSFSKTYKLKKQLPYLIKFYGIGILYEKAIAEEFKEHLKRNRKTREDIFSMITKTTGKVLTLDKISIFDYTYVYMTNSVTVSLKPIYVGTMLAAANKFLNEKKDNKKGNFDKTVGLFLKIK
jgi:hypothetical protein